MNKPPIIYTHAMAEAPLLADAFPEFALELESLLVKQGEAQLAMQIRRLRVVDRCRCGDDFCATFYMKAKPRGSWGPDNRCVEVTPEDGMIILDVSSGEISCVEVLFRDELRAQLLSVLP
jgi:hypothetical protein